MQTLHRLLDRLGRVAAMSSALLLLATLVQAHEVQPTVGDLTIEGGVATLDLRINLEAFLANIDLDSVDDTNDAVNADDYDDLRALSSDVIKARAPDLLDPEKME